MKEGRTDSGPMIQREKFQKLEMFTILTILRRNRAGNSAVETNFQQPSGWPGHHGHQPGPYDHKPALAPSPPSSPPDPRNKSSPVALTRGSTFSEPEPRPVISPPPTAIPTKAPISFKRGDRNIPELSRIAALKWRASKKESERFSSIFKKKIKYELPGDYLLDKVGKRDHVSIPYGSNTCTNSILGLCH